MRAFAVVPAAGASLRMGCDKLLLPWGGGALVDATLAAWGRSRVNEIVVTARGGHEQLLAVCRRAGVNVAVAASPPPDMKASALLALRFIGEQFAPGGDDVWLLAPADMPLLSAAVIDGLIAAHQARVASGRTAAILTPIADGKKGHPVLFPWSAATAVAGLGEEEGINALVDRLGALPLDVSSLVAHSAAFADIDTPDEYQRLSAEAAR